MSAAKEIDVEAWKRNLRAAPLDDDAACTRWFNNCFAVWLRLRDENLQAHEALRGRCRSMQRPLHAAGAAAHEVRISRHAQGRQ